MVNRTQANAAASSSCPCAGGFESELVELVGAELRALAIKHAGVLRERPEFEAVHATYHRIQDLHAGRLEGLATPAGEDRQAELRFTFAQLASAWLLHLEGHSPQQVSDRLGVHAAARWLERGSVPYLLARFDPRHREAKFKEFVAPSVSEKSESLAYVFGALLATLTRGSTFRSLSFSHQAEEPLRRVVDALNDSLGISPTLRQSTKSAGASYFEIIFNTRGPIEFLRGATQSGAHVPWAYLQCADERRSFLKGFFDFVSTNFLPQYGRFQFVKEGKSALVRDICVLLGREGVLPRIKGDQSSSFLIAQWEEFLRLRDLGVVMLPERKEALDVMCADRPKTRSGTLDEYRCFLKIGRQLEGFPDVTPATIIGAIKSRQPSFDVPYHIVRCWLAGDVPKVYDRMVALQSLELSLFPKEQRSEIGQAIIARLRGDWKQPARVVRAILDYFGRAETLAALSGLKISELEEHLEAHKPWPLDRYQKVLAAVGAELDAELAREMAFPSDSDIQSWLDAGYEELLYPSYRGSLLVALQEAFVQGRPVKAELKARLASLEQRRQGREAANE